MTDRKLMQQALEALESNPDAMVDCGDGHWDFKRDLAITALRAAIEQAQRNEFNPDWDAMAVMVTEQQRMAKRIEELEAKPRQWQGLTDEEIKIIWRDIDGSASMLMRFARAIEAKLKEKNHG